jgi:hypothetical protein
MRLTSSAGRRGFSNRAVFSLLFAIASSRGIAQNAAQFARTGDMTAPRSQHTATLLQDGRVLITGGVAYERGYRGTVLASAEVYDPATGTFTVTGSMSTERRMHTATLLPNGRVLIAGGYGQTLQEGSAELYDPTTGRFSATGNLLNARGGHDAILLTNGTVLIVGGFDGRYPLVPNAEIYDPANGVFTAVGPYLGHTICDFCPPSVLLADGRVLFSLQTPAQLYDPRTATFSATGRTNGAESAATLLMNGRVLLSGGEELGRSRSAEIYDPLTGTFVFTGDMTQRRVWHTLTLLPDGTVLTTGGETDECTANSCSFAGSAASAELYDPAKGAFAATGSMTASRETHTATLLNDGRVLIVGGVGYGGIGVFYGSASTAEIYTPATLIPPPQLLSTTEESKEGLVLHAGTGVLVSAARPAVPGEILELRWAGLRAESVIPPRVSIGGRLAEVLSFGALRDSSGVSTAVVRMPSGVQPGPAVAVQLSYVGRLSNTVTLAVRSTPGLVRPPIIWRP